MRRRRRVQALEELAEELYGLIVNEFDRDPMAMMAGYIAPFGDAFEVACGLDDVAGHAEELWPNRKGALSE